MALNLCDLREALRCIKDPDNTQFKWLALLGLSELITLLEDAALHDEDVNTVGAHFTTAQTNAALMTPVAGGQIFITRCSALVAHATTVDVAVDIGFHPTVTPVAAGVILRHSGIVPGSGVVEGSGAGVLGKGAIDDPLLITSTTPTTGALDIVISYYVKV